MLFLQAFGLHGHEEEGGAHDSHEEENGFIWKALVVLASVYAFFLFETLMHLGLKSKIGDHGGHSHIDVEVSTLVLQNPGGGGVLGISSGGDDQMGPKNQDP